jgi:ribose transport system permease protein
VSVLDLDDPARSVGAQPGPSAAPGRFKTLARRADFRRGGIMLPFLALFITLSAASGPFLTKTNLLNIVDQQASTLIPAVAVTLVLVTGGIDLSIGAVYGLASVVAANLALSVNPVLAIAAGLLVGFGVGLVNGVIITVFRINALIATLATSYVVSGISSLATGGNIITDFTKPGFGDLARTSFLTVKTSTWVTLGVVLLVGFMLARTTLGRYMYAAGGNAEAARLAGVQVYKVRIVAFALSGVAAALGGVIDASRVLSAESSGGSTLAFTVLAGVVVGGTSILGGVGAVWRSVVGVLFIALVGNGFDLLGYDPLYEQISLGVLLLLAVGLDAWTRLNRT